MICDKQHFNTLSEAATAAIGRSHAGRGKHGFKPYKCPQCGLYHLSSKTKKIKHAISDLPNHIHVVGTPKAKYNSINKLFENDRVVFTLTHRLNLPIELINQTKK